MTTRFSELFSVDPAPASVRGLEGRATTGRGYRLFVVLWVISGCVNVRHGLAGLAAADGPTAQGLLAMLTIAAGIWVLRRIRAAQRFVLFAALEACFHVASLPLIPNHSVLILIMDLTFLGAWVFVLLARRVDRGSLETLCSVFAPVIRVELLLLYFFVLLHKMNSDFFSSEVTCAYAVLDHLRTTLPVLPQHELLRGLSLYGTLFAEATIPLLLIVRRLRAFGVLFACGFHFVLGLSASTFSIFIFAPLVLFVPDSLFDRLPAAALRRRVLVALVLGFAAGCVLNWLGWTDISSLRRWIAFVLGGAIVTNLAGLVWADWRVRDSSGQPPDEGPAFLCRPLLLLPLLQLLIGVGPYLGLNNTRAWAMYSNLRTEGGTSNHLLIPVSWQVAPYLSDVVTITASSNHILRRFTKRAWDGIPISGRYGVYRHGAFDALEEPHWKLTYATLRVYVNRLVRRGATGIKLSYVRAGREYDFTHAERQPDFVEVPYLLRKLLLPRPIPDDPRGLCLW